MAPRNVKPSEGLAVLLFLGHLALGLPVLLSLPSLSSTLARAAAPARPAETREDSEFLRC